ncbi:MAG: recombination mediator RecR [Hyphomicrobiaceae bacterium]|nr:recombination mediator RecR [Hyphomicrobiaceae bacterium]
MTRTTAGPEIERIIKLLSRLPGLGPRSARKAALALIKRRDDLLVPLAEALRVAVDRITTCPACGNIDTTSPCALCADPGRDDTTLVVVEEVADLWALERAGVTRARYHVLGGHLSPLDGIGPDALNIARLVERAGDGRISEIILALNATVEGQSTMHYVREVLAPTGVVVSEIQKGVPIGGELDYLDDGTLNAAIRSRRRL